MRKKPDFCIICEESTKKVGTETPRSTIGAVTINHIEIRGGGANSLIADVEVKYSAHYPSTYTQEEMLELLNSTIQGAAMTDLWLREHPPVLEVSAANDGFCTDIQNPVVDVLRQAHGQVYGEPAIACAWVAGCDADVISQYAPCLVYGPTGAGAHAANECSKLQDLVDTAKVYAMTAMDFCK